MGKLAVVKNESLLPSFLNDVLSQDAGKGVSQSQEDNIVPLIYVLQANSPVAKKNNPAHIEGAGAGDIWKKNSVHREIIPGDEGIIVQPCYFERVWIEWRPNRGGFVAPHKERPSDATEETIVVEGKEKRVWQRANGNLLVETRQHVVLVDGREPYVIPFSSSGHTVSRTWMSMMAQNYIPNTNKPCASWAKYYKLRTTERSNTLGSWYTLKVEDAGWVESNEQYMRGKALNQAFEKGEKSAAVDEVMESQSEATVSDEEIPF